MLLMFHFVIIITAVEFQVVSRFYLPQINTHMQRKVKDIEAKLLYIVPFPHNALLILLI